MGLSKQIASSGPVQPSSQGGQATHRGRSTSPGGRFHTKESWRNINEAQSQTDGERIRTLRAPADAFAAQQKELVEASRGAYAAGRKAEAHALSQEAKRVDEAKDRANEAAAWQIFLFKNERVEEWEVDLHGLTVQEAVEYTGLRLGFDAATQPRPDKLVVIYGAGNHSVGKVSKLKPAVLEFLHRYHLQSLEGQPTAGSCTVLYSWPVDGATLAPLAAQASARGFTVRGGSQGVPGPAVGGMMNPLRGTQGQGQAQEQGGAPRGQRQQQQAEEAEATCCCCIC